MAFHRFSELFPLLQGREFDELAADIKRNGLREPVWLHDGQVLDGRNRWRACQQLGVEAKTRVYTGDDPLAFVISLNLHRRQLSESQRAMVAAKIANMPQGARTDLASIEAMSQPQAAERLNVGRASVQRAREVLDHGAPELAAAVDAGVITVSAAADLAKRPAAEQVQVLKRAETEGKDVRIIARRHDLAKQREAIARGEISLPQGQFDLLVIDPPWPYETSYGVNWRGACPYPVMPLEEIGALDIPALAAPDCVLWLWTTHTFLPHAFPLIAGWGFAYKVCLVWVKPRAGLGAWVRSQCEFCLMAVRGRPAIDLTTQTTVLHAPVREHSRKPDEFYAMVESLCVSERRLDFFSREPRKGWSQFGDDTRRFVARA
jgi:N6-adenosine-specific RNA methylase IME4